MQEWRLANPAGLTSSGLRPPSPQRGEGRSAFKPAVEAPYRWRDWAAKNDGITGDELLAFINNEEATRPDGSRGPGLFRYLRTLTGSDAAGVANSRDVIATVFKGVDNRPGCYISGFQP